MSEWWQEFFDAQYLALWGQLFSPEESQRDAEGLCKLLKLGEGDRCLDAACGFGRISAPLAARGVSVYGVDQSPALLARAREAAGDKEHYFQADLRHPLPDDYRDFDAAISMFSSLGYGSDADDLAVFRTVFRALKSGGRFFVDTMHRDAVIWRLAKEMVPGRVLPDGTEVWETPDFDPVDGRMNTTWHWKGPKGSGSKSASLRIYTITELVRLAEAAGFELERAMAGVSGSDYRKSSKQHGERLGLLLRKPS